MPHTLVTQYRYYSLNQVVEQKSPDGGLSKFWYDQLGRLVFSQNEKQYQVNQYSYTRYDLLGRIEEVGQLTSNATMTQAIAQSVSLTNTWMNTTVNASKEQITRTVYDVSQSSLCTPAPSVLCQRNLRNRVSYSYVQPTASFSNNSLPYTSATYYSYDIHGNVDVLLQHYNSGIMQTIAGNAFKRIEYKYDLISGKVNEVAYQPGYSDQFYHRYSYDAENKLTKAYTSPDRIVWELEADYSYYRHGPLARVELGETGVQGMDYAYTLQGWLKTVNSTAVTSAADMGGDGTLTGRKMAGDVYGFALHYNSTDYKAINLSKTVVAPVTNTALPAFKDLYNGNIAAMAVTFSHDNFGAAGAGLNQPLLYKYRYDQLNRIREMDAYSGLNQATNAWTFSSPMTAYQERVSYDGNGNILTYTRNGDAARTAMDNMTYSYVSGTNKLDKVVDVATDAIPANYPNYNDLKTGQATGNYAYDAIGNLIKDQSEGISQGGIVWNVYGKIASVTKSGVTTSYTYDASGNRISKTTGSKTTFYVRDASGNVMAVYESGNANINGGNLSQIEVHLYGSSRLGIWNPNRNVQVVPAPVTYPMTGLSSAGVVRTYKRGLKFFELSNHLGNVLLTVSDRKVAKDANTDGVIDSYVADVVSGGDYYPFGMQMPSRNYSTDKYRYGFNGKEKDKDINSLTAYDYGFRIYNPTLGKFLSVDPLTQKYPWYTPYQFAGNKPIKFIDLDGAEEQKHWYDYSAMDLMNWLGEPDNPFKDNGFMHKFATSTNRGINPFYNGAALVFGENNLGPSSDYTPMRRHEAAFNLITQWMIWKYLKIAESKQTPANLEGSLGKPSPQVETKPQQQTTQLKPSNDDIQKVKEWVKANPSKAEVKSGTPIQKISAKLNSAQVGTDYHKTASEVVNNQVQARGKGLTGTYDFVITNENRLVLGKGHFNLSGGANTVQAAGQIKLYNGKVTLINNNSGHYTPNLTETANFGAVFDAAGLNVSGVKLQTFSAGNKTPITTRIE